MTPQELRSHILRKAEAHADRMEALDNGTAVPALEEPRDDPEPSMGHRGAEPWYKRRDEAQDVTEETFVSLSSLNMDIRTIRRRIAKFLDADDYTLTKQGNRIIFNINADMIGYITRRLY